MQHLSEFYSIPPLIEHNNDIFALAETKLDSSHQFLKKNIQTTKQIIDQSVY